MSYCFGRLYLQEQHKNSFASSFSTQTMNAHTNAALYGPARFASRRLFFSSLLDFFGMRFPRSRPPTKGLHHTSYQPVRPLDRTAGGAYSNSVASSLLSPAFRIRPNPTNSIWAWKFPPILLSLEGAQMRPQTTGRSSRANSRGRLWVSAQRQQRYRSQICFGKLCWSLYLYQSYKYQVRILFENSNKIRSFVTAHK